MPHPLQAAIIEIYMCQFDIFLVQAFKVHTETMVL